MSADEQPAAAAPPPRFRVPRWLWRVVFVVGLVISLGLTFGIGAWLTIGFVVRRSPEVLTPAVVGQDLAIAEAMLRNAGLTPEVAARRNDPATPEGKVLGQSPAAGAATRPGRPVRLTVSLGGARTTVPNLVGGSQNRAVLALRAAGLGMDASARAVDSGAPVGRVLGQHPPAGSDAAPGESVAVLLSAGPSPRTFVMPDLVGRPARRTAAELTRRGFRRVQVVGVGPAGGDPPVSAQDPRKGYPVSVEDLVLLTATGG